MSTSSLHISPTKHFLLGIILGVGLEALSNILVSIFYTVLNAIVWDLVGNNATFFALLNILIKLGLLVISLIVAQKVFKNKFVVVGMFGGFISALILLGIQNALIQSVR